VKPFLTRRRLLQAGGLATGATLLGGLAESPASASVSTSIKFDLGNPSTALIRDKAITDGTVMQSFAFDNTNKRIYFAQLTEGGGNGDITITKTDLAGNPIGPGHVYLNGFGHGTQIAVQPSGGGAYVWVEAAAATSGYGTKLARFYFNNYSTGQTLSSSTSGVEIFDPWPDATSKSIAIDPYWKRVSIRYKLNDTVWYTLYNLSEFAVHDYSNPLCDIAVADYQTFQGHTTYGSYLYILTGTSYDDPYGDPYDGKLSDGSYVSGDTNIRAINWNTGGGGGSPSLTKAGYTLYYREPEGMAIQLPDPSYPSQARLCFGFASGTSGNRKASIYYKEGVTGP